MFAPNRLLTPKEQWLLLGTAAAVLVGSITLVYHHARQAGIDEMTPLTGQGEFSTASHEDIVSDAASVPFPAPLSAPVFEIVGEGEAIDVAPALIGVAVMGAVRRPDLYMVVEGTRLTELIEMAGGATETADLSDIRLTASAIDETTLTIPELPATEQDDTRIAMRRATTTVVNPPQYRRHAPLLTPVTPQQDAPHTRASPSVAAGTSASGLLNINTATNEQLQGLPGIGAVFAARIIEERRLRPFTSVEELTRVSGIGEKRLEALRPLVTVH